MFDDPRKELERLQAQLLEDDEWFEKELESARALIGDAPRKPAKKNGNKAKPRQEEVHRKQPKARKAAAPVRNYANNYGQDKPPVRNNGAAKPQKGIGGLVVLALLETMGIVGVVAYWLLVLLK